MVVGEVSSVYFPLENQLLRGYHNVTRCPPDSKVTVFTSILSVNNNSNRHPLCLLEFFPGSVSQVKNSFRMTVSTRQFSFLLPPLNNNYNNSNET